MSVPSQVSEHLFTCVLIVSILLLSTIFLLDFGTVLTSGIVSFSFYWLSNLLILSLPDEGYSEST